MAVGAATALVLAACTGGDAGGQSKLEDLGAQAQSGGQTLMPREAAPEGFTDYYQQKVQWRQCEADEIVEQMMPEPEDLENYECTSFVAPLNWDEPDSDPVELVMGRYVAAGRDAPALFYNLGGPGGAAVQSLSSVVAHQLPEKLARTFQIVGLDPRGVGGSTPVQCYTDEERDAEAEREVDLSDKSGQQKADYYAAEVEKLAEKCQENSGEILGYVDTDSATRDFDLARALLEQDKLNMVGYSYGTLLVATYAQEFPHRAGRLVLDGPVDPTVGGDELAALQLEGMENSLYHWIEYCQAGISCPLDGDLEDGKKQMIDLLAQIEDAPLPTADPDRMLNVSQAVTGVVGSLYREDTYPLLTEVVATAMEGDGSGLQFVADFYRGRQIDGTYDNGEDAFFAVNALDYEPSGTVDEWEANGIALAEEFPVLGEGYGFGSAGLEQWPYESRKVRSQLAAPQAPPLLIIGTTNDPATPYVMAEGLADQLVTSVLVTVEGWSHGAYTKDADKCVVDVVDAFLLDGVVPVDGLVCE